MVLRSAAEWVGAVDWSVATTLTVVAGERPLRFEPAHLQLTAGSPYVIRFCGNETTRWPHTFTAPAFLGASAVWKLTDDGAAYRADAFAEVETRSGCGGGCCLDHHLVPVSAGTYPLVCSRGTHAARGMNGTISVAPSAAADEHPLAAADAWALASDEAHSEAWAGWEAAEERVLTLHDYNFTFGDTGTNATTLVAGRAYRLRLANGAATARKHDLTAGAFFGGSVVRSLRDASFEVVPSGALTSVKMATSAPGAEVEVLLVPRVAGSYGCRCSVGDGNPWSHTAKGMVGTIDVLEDPTRPALPPFVAPPPPLPPPPVPHGVRLLNSRFRLAWFMSSPGLASFTLTLDQLTWVALGVSKNGEMIFPVSSKAVTGSLDEGVLKRTLTNQATLAADPTLLPEQPIDAVQDLQNTSFTQRDGQTVMKFDAPMPWVEQFNPGGGRFWFVFAHGSPGVQTFGYHGENMGALVISRADLLASATAAPMEYELTLTFIAEAPVMAIGDAEKARIADALATEANVASSTISTQFLARPVASADQGLDQEDEATIDACSNNYRHGLCFTRNTSGFELSSGALSPDLTTIDLSSEFRIAFAVSRPADDDPFISVELQAHTTGWVGFGLLGSSVGHGMVQTDMWWGRVRDGHSEMYDSFSAAVAAPRRDDTLGGTDDLFDVSGEEALGVTLLRFKRKLNTSSAFDWPITHGSTGCVYAFNSGDSDSLSSYHGPTRGFATVEFFREPCGDGSFPSNDDLCPSAESSSAGQGVVLTLFVPVAVAAGIFLLLILYLCVRVNRQQTRAAMTIRLVATRRPPDLTLAPGRRWHTFASHTC